MSSLFKIKCFGHGFQLMYQTFLKVLYGEPEDPDDAEHVAATDRYRDSSISAKIWKIYVNPKMSNSLYMQFYIGWFFHPIFSTTGDYPAVMREYIDRRSPANNSRLPTFTETEIERLKGASDFMGVQHYTARLVRPGVSPQQDPYRAASLNCRTLACPTFREITTTLSVPSILVHGCRCYCVARSNLAECRSVLVTRVSSRHSTVVELDNRRVWY